MKEMITKMGNKITEAAGIILGRIAWYVSFAVCAAIGFIYSRIKIKILSYKQLHQQRIILKQFKFAEDNHFCDFVFEGKRFHVYRNSYILNHVGILGAGVLGRPYRVLRKINIDDNFVDKFSTNLKIFVLAHEASHILNRDFCARNMKEIQKQALKCGTAEQATMIAAQRQYAKELAADRRAADFIGYKAALEGLAELYTLVPLEEIASRYEILGGNREDLRSFRDVFSVLVKNTENTVSFDDL